MCDTENKCRKLFAACESGDKSALIKLVTSEGVNPSAYDMVNDQSKTPLHIACRYGHIDIVRMLVEVYGCSPNAVDNTCSMPIHDACYYDQVLIVDYLIHTTPEPNKCLLAVDLKGNTAFHKANQSGSSHVIKYILHIAFSGQTPQKLSLDIDYHFYSHIRVRDSNMHYFLVRNKVGDTPLAVACRHGHSTIVKMYMQCHDHFPGEILESIPYLLNTASKCGQFEIAHYLQSYALSCLLYTSDAADE